MRGWAWWWDLSGNVAIWIILEMKHRARRCLLAQHGALLGMVDSPALGRLTKAQRISRSRERWQDVFPFVFNFQVHECLCLVCQTDPANSPQVALPCFTRLYHGYCSSVAALRLPNPDTLPPKQQKGGLFLQAHFSTRRRSVFSFAILARERRELLLKGKLSPVVHSTPSFVSTPSLQAWS